MRGYPSSLCVCIFYACCSSSLTVVIPGCVINAFVVVNFYQVKNMHLLYLITRVILIGLLDGFLLRYVSYLLLFLWPPVFYWISKVRHVIARWYFPYARIEWLRVKFREQVHWRVYSCKNDFLIQGNKYKSTALSTSFWITWKLSYSSHFTLPKSLHWCTVFSSYNSMYLVCLGPAKHDI